MPLAALLWVATLGGVIPSAEVTVNLRPDRGDDRHVTVQLPEASDERHHFASISADERTLLHIHIDSHLGWHEILLSNGSIERGPGAYHASYEVTLNERPGARWTVRREGAEFKDGTGYLELFGRPQVAVGRDAGWYYRNLIALLRWKPGPYLTALVESRPPPGLDAYPHRDSWDAANWHRERFDRAYSTHQTGSPAVHGAVNPIGARVFALDDSAGVSTAGDDALQRAYTDALWGVVGQQCRRPLHFHHDAGGEVWSAPDWPALVMGEWGPVRLWGSTELWGRSPSASHGPWNGWDLEHLEVDTQAMAWVLFGSRYALRQMRHKLEGVLTHPHLKQSKETTPRIFGLGLKALALGAALDPDPARAARYRAGADFLIGTFRDHFRRTPRLSMLSTLTTADGRHLMPAMSDLRAYFAWKDWRWIEDDPALAEGATLIAKLERPRSPRERAELQRDVDRFLDTPAGRFRRAVDEARAKRAALNALDVDDRRRKDAAYAAGEAEKQIVWAISNYVAATHGSKEQYDMMRVWAFVPCFQVGTIAAGIVTYADLDDHPRFAGGPARTSAKRTAKGPARDVLAYLMTEARNPAPGGTFWYDTAVWLKGVNVGTGRDTEGVVHWVAGGLGILGRWVSPAWADRWHAAVDSIYRRSPSAAPGASLSSFESWFLPYAAETRRYP